MLSARCLTQYLPRSTVVFRVSSRLRRKVCFQHRGLPRRERDRTSRRARAQDSVAMGSSVIQTVPILFASRHRYGRSVAAPKVATFCSVELTLRTRYRFVGRAGRGVILTSARCTARKHVISHGNEFVCSNGCEIATLSRRDDPRE